MSGNGRGGNNNRRKPFRHRDRAGDETAVSGHDPWQDNPAQKKSRKPEAGFSGLTSAKTEQFERPKWAPVKLSAAPLPSHNCSICGKSIKDMASALTDKSGLPAHFDCVLEKVTDNEAQEKGDVVSYIGGGRFGVVHYANPQDVRGFKIKKIIEWEDKENRADWRKNIADHFSVT
ncbi:MAG: hypothetical protein LBT16_13900 [Treponema sp.]|jgi:hypothetical protein|nr:hypothetical protein [Treponema sp.]